MQRDKSGHVKTCQTSSHLSGFRILSIHQPPFIQLLKLCGATHRWCRKINHKNLTFMCPWIADIFPSITNKLQRYTIYLFLWNALNISGGTSAHHQELKTVYTASGTCQTFTVACRYRGRVEHVSGGTFAHHQELKTLYTASGTCQTFTAACRYRGRVAHVSGGTYLHHQELKTVYTVSGTCQNFTAACRYRGRVPTLPR
jgi:hypothetical protein